MQERFHRYRLTKEIASTPSGSVYLAHHVNHVSQKVALKVFEAAYITSEQQSQNFVQQAERIRALKHCSIVPILDLGVEQGKPYVVREYLASSSLRHRLDELSAQRLTLQEALMIIFQVGQALSYAHEHGILHGNLKPENIFFNDNGTVLLADFAPASITEMRKLDDQSDLQTMSYVAPEQLVGSMTEKSDQYALACLAYELITGHAPFSAQSFYPIISPISVDGEPAKAIQRKESHQRDQTRQLQAESSCENSQCPDYGKVGSDNIRKFGKTRRGVQRWQCKTCRMTWSASSMWAKHHTELIPLSDLVPNLPEPIEAVVLKAMAKDPSQRYADIAIFLRALQIVLHLSTSASTDSPIGSAVTPLSRSMTEPLEKTESEAPQKMESEALLTTDPLEHWKHGKNGYHASKTIATSRVDDYHANTALATSKTENHLASKTLAKSKTDAYRANKDLVEVLPEGRHPQLSKPSPPTLWLAFALSGIVLLLGTVILYSLAPLRSPGSTSPVKSSPTVQSSMQATNAPTPQPSTQATSIPIVQPSSPKPAPTIAPTPSPPVSYDASDSRNTLSSGARLVNCSNCPNGYRVGYIGLNAGEAGTLQFNNVSKNVAGTYTLTIDYIIAGSDKLAMYISVNEGPAVVLNVSQTANGDTVGTATISISLNAGNNTIEFSNPSEPAPDLDWIVA